MERLPDFKVVRPRTVAAALTARQRDDESRFIAGGTDLITNLRHGLGTPRTLIDLRGIRDLRRIESDAASLKLGAAVTLVEFLEQPELCARYPALASAAQSVAAPAHREAATIGGNLCLDTRCVFYNRSAWWREANGFCLKYRGATCHVAPSGKRCHAAYSGDLAPALMVYGAELEIASPRGLRRMPLAELYAEDGAAHLRLGSDELLVALWLPADPLPAGYAKARARGAIDFPLAGVAVALKAEQGLLRELRVALTGTNSRPLCLEGLASLTGSALDEAALEQLGKLVQRQATPMRTTLISAQYRRRAAAALARRLAAELFAAAAEEESSV